MNKIPLRALIYYLLLILFTFVYNILAEILYYIKTLFGTTWAHMYSNIIKNLGYNNKITYYYAHAHLLVLKLVGTKIFLNQKISSDRMLWISNHRSKLDGLLIQCILCANGNNVTTVTKKIVGYFPIFGSFGKNIHNIFIERNKNIAEKILTDASHKTIDDNGSILIFPEGTTMSSTNMELSNKYATDNDLQQLKNVLLPRTTGFDIIHREGNFNKVGNITIQYKKPSIPYGMQHSFVDLFLIFPTEIYLDIQYDNIKSKDLYRVFEEKDKNLEKKINRDSYRENNCYSTMCIILNAIIFIGFYLLFLLVPSFCYTATIFTIFIIMTSFFRKS